MSRYKSPALSSEGYRRSSTPSTSSRGKSMSVSRSIAPEGELMLDYAHRKSEVVISSLFKSNILNKKKDNYFKTVSLFCCLIH